MSRIPTDESALKFAVNAKLHEDFKIRLYYDDFRTQSRFFRMCMEAYLEQDKLFLEFMDDYKIKNGVQSKARAKGSIKLRDKGESIMKELALTEDDIENIFDILEEDLPEL